MRIAVAVDPGGEWNAFGWGGHDGQNEKEPMAMALQAVAADAARYWIEADLPIPARDASGGTGEVEGAVHREGLAGPG